MATEKMLFHEYAIRIFKQENSREEAEDIFNDMLSLGVVSMAKLLCLIKVPEHAVPELLRAMIAYPTLPNSKTSVDAILAQDSCAEDLLLAIRSLHGLNDLIASAKASEGRKVDAPYEGMLMELERLFPEVYVMNFGDPNQ